MSIMIAKVSYVAEFSGETVMQYKQIAGIAQEVQSSMGRMVEFVENEKHTLEKQIRQLLQILCELFNHKTEFDVTVFFHFLFDFTPGKRYWNRIYYNSYGTVLCDRSGYDFPQKPNRPIFLFIIQLKI